MLWQVPMLKGELARILAYPCMHMQICWDNLCNYLQNISTNLRQGYLDITDG